MRTEKERAHLIRPFDETRGRLGERLPQGRVIVFAEATDFFQRSDQESQRSALGTRVTALFFVQRVRLGNNE